MEDGGGEVGGFWAEDFAGNFPGHGDEADEAAAGAGAEGGVGAVDVDGPGGGVGAFEEGVWGAVCDVEAEGLAFVTDGSGF